MAITAKQFHYLETMGVSLWQRRDGFYTDELSTVAKPKNKVKATTTAESKLSKVADIEIAKKPEIQPQVKPDTLAINIPLSELINSDFFADILMALDIKAEQLSQSQSGIVLPSFRWQFSEANIISFADGTLTSPITAKIAESAELKHQLWLVFTQILNSKITTDS